MTFDDEPHRGRWRVVCVRCHKTFVTEKREELCCSRTCREDLLRSQQRSRKQERAKRTPQERE